MYMYIYIYIYIPRNRILGIVLAVLWYRVFFKFGVSSQCNFEAIELALRIPRNIYVDRAFKLE